ncbi:MAG: PilZ domain-containing protein, partial [Myxococcota bacterium]
MSPDADLPEISPGDSDYPDFHRSTRMPLDAVVRLHFEGTVAYQNGFAANVSATGMYVKHPDPPPVGTRLVFELVLGEERKPVQGAGVVAWSREKYEGPGRPAGIGIQFTEIDALSRQHIAEGLFAYLETQLGDELAENPDVAELVATSTSKASPELLESIGRSADAATSLVSRTPPEGMPAPVE